MQIYGFLNWFLTEVHGGTVSSKIIQIWVHFYIFLRSYVYLFIYRVYIYAFRQLKIFDGYALILLKMVLKNIFRKYL